MSYYFSKTIEGEFPVVVEQVIAALKESGFGIISRIDMKETFEAKIGKTIRPYLILGACNPNYAYEALQKEDKVGTMLPCNVIVRETENGQIEVAAVDPVASMASIKNPELLTLAGEVARKLKEAVAGLAAA